MKLKIELQKIFDTGLAVRVIDQPEYKLHDILFESNGMRLQAYHYDFLCIGIFCIPHIRKPRGILSYTYENSFERDKMHDFILEAVEHINKSEILTFERISKECVPMKHLLVNEEGNKRLYLGFNRNGDLVTDHYTGRNAIYYSENEITNWTIEEYKEKK